MALAKVPRISIRELRAGVPHEVQKLAVAASGIGFFYAVDHGISTEFLARVRRAAHQVFALPEAEKHDIHLSNSSNWRGWSAIDEEVTSGVPDHKETLDFGIEEPFVEEVPGEPWRRMRGPNQFPASMPELRPLVSEMIQKVGEVGHVILQGLATAMDLPADHFSRHFLHPFALLRFLKYPPTQGERIGIGEHSDYGCLTLIDQDPDVGGLQARSVSGEWLDVDPIPGSFAVNLGDVLAAWSAQASEGRLVLRATPHRVINKSSDRPRLSIPVFFDPSLETRLDGLLHRSGCKPVNIYGEHLFRAYSASYPDTQTKDRE